MSDDDICTTSAMCLNWREDVPEAEHLADVLGHDHIGHRALLCLAKEGHTSVEAVSRLTDRQIKDCPGAGQGVLTRIHERILNPPEMPGWTIERIEAVLDAGEIQTFRHEMRTSKVGQLRQVFLRWQDVAEGKPADAKASTPLTGER